MAVSMTTMEQTLEIYRKAPTYIDNLVLTAGVAQVVTPPVGATHVLFSATGNYLVNWSGGTAAVPVTSVVDGSGAEINPVGRAIGGKVTLATQAAKSFSVVGQTNCTLALSWCTI